MTETSPSKSHEGNLCWNCAHLGGCLHASGRVKRCGKFELWVCLCEDGRQDLWKDPAMEAPVPRKAAAKICGLGVRTVIRYAKREGKRKVLFDLFRKKGYIVEFRPDRVWKGTQVYQIYVIGREKA